MFLTIAGENGRRLVD